MKKKRAKCDGCTICCKSLPIKWMSSPAGEYCKECTELKGCNIFNKAPKGCLEYNCIYLLEELDLSLRPDKCHIIFEKLPDCKVYVGIVTLGYGKKWFSSVVEEFVDQALSRGCSVVIGEIGSPRKFIKTPKGVSPEKAMSELEFAYLNLIRA